MHVLTLSSGLYPSPAQRSLLRAIAAIPTPRVSGLSARHWSAGPREVYGRYLFDDRAALDQFASDPERYDPDALALIRTAAGCLTTSKVEVVMRDDVFDRPIIIVSAPRAGSTLLFELLARASGVYTMGGESHGVIEGIPDLHPANRGYHTHALGSDDANEHTVRVLRSGIVAELHDVTNRRYLDEPEPARTAHVRFLEKTPENALRIPFLQQVFADARFVFLYRDARQNVSSLIDAWKHGGFVNIPDLPGWSRKAWCFLLAEGWQRLDPASLAGIAAFQWAAANECASSDLAAVARRQWLAVSYAELVTRPAETLRRICAFAELEIGEPLRQLLARPLASSSTTISPPSPLKWVTNRELRSDILARLGPLEGRLRNLNSAGQPTARTPGASTVRFACFLDEIVPNGEGLSAPLTVNPRLVVQIGATVPLAIFRRARHRERFVADHPILWVEDDATSVLSPFFLRRKQAVLALHLAPGAVAPPSLDAELVARLRTAGVLIDGAGRASPCARAPWLATARANLATHRFCRLTSLIHREQIAALARYYNALIATRDWDLGDAQVERRYGWHNEAVARFFHGQLSSFVSQLADEPCKPTYCYTSAYQSGASLDAHMDRRQCEWTMSLLVESVSQAEGSDWPLWFDTPSGKVSVRLSAGDAVLFRGCELPHWREPTQETHRQIMLLFHWVPATFVGVLD